MRGKIHIVFPMMTIKLKCGEKGKQEPTLEWVASRVKENYNYKLFIINNNYYK